PCRRQDLGQGMDGSIPGAQSPCQPRRAAPVILRAPASPATLPRHPAERMSNDARKRLSNEGRCKANALELGGCWFPVHQFLSGGWCCPRSRKSLPTSTRRAIVISRSCERLLPGTRPAITRRMHYLFADGTPFPLAVNFIDLLKDSIDCAAELLR